MYMVKLVLNARIMACHSNVHAFFPSLCHPRTRPLPPSQFRELLSESLRKCGRLDRQLKVLSLSTDAFLSQHSMPPVTPPTPPVIPTEPCAKEIWLTKCYPLVAYRSQLQPEAMQDLYENHARLDLTLREVRAGSLQDVSLLERDLKEIKDQQAKKFLATVDTVPFKARRIMFGGRG